MSSTGGTAPAGSGGTGGGLPGTGGSTGGSSDDGSSESGRGCSVSGGERPLALLVGLMAAGYGLFARRRRRA
jgi:MYXO-CTERM domain-containing protein